MERKIGEIFEHNGEWYQTVEAPIDEHSCNGCQGCKGTGGPRIFGGECNGNARKDNKFVIFKKLEKVGEPIIYMSRTFQKLKSSDTEQCKYCYFRNQVCNPQLCGKESFLVEIKQNKENMGEKKLNLKPFDIQKAREGKPVCTRGGRRVRIIYFDAKGDYPIVALIETGNGEKVVQYMIDGHCTNIISQCYDDLMMLPEKKEGWVNVDKRSNGDVIISKPYPTRDEAIHNSIELTIDTVNIEWEE